ncbi:MAG: type II toxin-antitoxin system VapC family toxin [Methylacidiphilales bacterium]|nr:type II toxin-antitoxin system VapC family toxin [Candidatus Methylacidiphilales bacterium]
MKGMVVDASIAASWLLNDELNETAEWVLDQMQAGTPVSVPSLWLLEITNVLFNAERRKRIDRKHRDGALERIERLPLTILAAPMQADLKMLRFFAEKHQMTAYDAEYLRVAKEQKLMLASLDGNLLAAAKREGVRVVAKA